MENFIVKSVNPALNLICNTQQALWHCQHFFIYNVTSFTVKKLKRDQYEVLAECDAATAWKIGNDYANYLLQNNKQ